MFGIFNLTREDEEQGTRKTDDNKNNDDLCYGGFSSRWSYEDCRRKLAHPFRSANPATAAICALICVFFGLAGMACGILLYDFVQSNRELYYPSGALPEPDEIILPYSAVPDIQSAAKSPVLPTENGESMYVNDDGVTFENVTDELSKLYCIPRGVMIMVSDNESGMKLAGFAVGDIIVAVNENEVYDIDELNRLYELYSEDDTVTFRIFRKNKYIDVVVVKNPESETDI